jgi:hypothetical protein
MSTVALLTSFLQRPLDLEHIFITILVLIALFYLVVIIVLVVQSKRANLSDIPGPLIAQYTDAWNLYATYKAIHTDDKASYHHQLQSKYGNVVRTGPRTVSIFDPAAVAVIYGVRSKLNKVIESVPTR